MLVDISHVPAATMQDAIRVSRVPVIALHSSARAVADHPRNVPDNVLRFVRDNGGVVMVNFYSRFVVPESAAATILSANKYRELRKQIPDEREFTRTRDRYQKQHPVRLQPGTIHRMLDYIEHIAKVAGANHVGLGADIFRCFNAAGAVARRMAKSGSPSQ